MGARKYGTAPEAWERLGRVEEGQVGEWGGLEKVSVSWRKRKSWAARGREAWAPDAPSGGGGRGARARALPGPRWWGRCLRLVVRRQVGGRIATVGGKGTGK